MKKLSKDEMKMVMGGVEGREGDFGDGGTSCSADCPAGKSASITNCDGTRTGYTGYAECVGPNNTLKKNCK